MSLVVAKEVHIAESMHWYTVDGKPAYEVMGKNGKMRPTTLRDARGGGLIPSVTTVMRNLRSEGLERWKLEEMLHAALTLPRLDNEPESAFLDRIRDDSRETGKKAAERGTSIHAAVEAFYNGQEVKDHHDHIDGVQTSLDRHFGRSQWISEKSFASEYGYGGKVDLCGEAGVLDVKTKEFDSSNLPKGYRENLMQLAAYRVGLKMPHARCANVFVSVSEPGLVHIKEWTQAELQQGWKMFSALLEFWYADTGLNIPRKTVYCNHDQGEQP